jgi:hypothetical protein
MAVLLMMSLPESSGAPPRLTRKESMSVVFGDTVDKAAILNQETAVRALISKLCFYKIAQKQVSTEDTCLSLRLSSVCPSVHLSSICRPSVVRLSVCPSVSTVKKEST